jgi:hypothetical protein
MNKFEKICLAGFFLEVLFGCRKRKFFGLKKLGPEFEKFSIEAPCCFSECSS